MSNCKLKFACRKVKRDGRINVLSIYSGKSRPGNHACPVDSPAVARV